MIKKIDHIVITTANLSDCLDFYQKLGFQVNQVGGRYELLAGDFKINVHIKGSELTPHAQNVQIGSADFCFEINGSLTEYVSVLEAKNLVIELGVVQRKGVYGEMNSIYLRDPDGNLIEFCSYK